MGRIVQKVVIVKEDAYNAILKQLIAGLEGKICYVAMNKPHDILHAQLEHINKQSQFHIIDTLTSHYRGHQHHANCTFLPSAGDLHKLKQSILDAYTNKGCKAVLFDPITELLFYRPGFEVLGFVNDLKSSLPSKLTTVAIALADDEKTQHTFLFDLKMFADTVDEHV